MADHEKVVKDAQKWLGLGTALVTVYRVAVQTKENADTGRIDEVKFLGLKLYSRQRAEARRAARKAR